MTNALLTPVRAVVQQAVRRHRDRLAGLVGVEHEARLTRAACRACEVELAVGDGMLDLIASAQRVHVVVLLAVETCRLVGIDRATRDQRLRVLVAAAISLEVVVLRALAAAVPVLEVFAMSEFSFDADVVLK